MREYPTVYTDSLGKEETKIINDGTTLRMELRGVIFEDRSFDSFEPAAKTDPILLEFFVLNRNELCSCQIDCEIPIPIVERGKERDGRLKVHLILGEPNEKGGLDKVNLSLILLYEGNKFDSSGKSGWFEDELLEIQKQLPEMVYMKSCINCLFSDYSPYGHGLYGFMMCFRNLKEEYLKVETKDDFWGVHDHYDRMVQETYVCSEFELRKPGTGYRG